MSTGLSACIPTPCQAFGVTGIALNFCNTIWRNNRECPASFDSIYDVLYSLSLLVPVGANGATDIIYEKFSSLRFYSVVVASLPYIATFLLTFISFTLTDVISWKVAVVLSFSLIIVSLICITLVLQHEQDLLGSIVPDVLNKVYSNATDAVMDLDVGEEIQLARRISSIFANPISISCDKTVPPNPPACSACGRCSSGTGATMTALQASDLAYDDYITLRSV